MKPLDEIEQMEERHEFIARQFEDLGMARRAATERSMAQAEAMRLRNPQEEHQGHRYDIGDWVKVKIHNRTKWGRKWAGPFMVIKLSFPHTYYLMTFRGDWLDTPVNEERLAPWKGTSPDEVNPIEDSEVIHDVTERVEDNALEGEDSLLAEPPSDTRTTVTDDPNRDPPDSVTPLVAQPRTRAPVIIRPRHLR
jgi:hypothetical protein